MSGNGFDAISQGKKFPSNIARPKLTHFSDIANLDINDGARDPFAMWDTAPPPAPKLKNKGVIAMDITEQFGNAARRMCDPPASEKYITC